MLGFLDVPRSPSLIFSFSLGSIPHLRPEQLPGYFNCAELKDLRWLPAISHKNQPLMAPNPGNYKGQKLGFRFTMEISIKFHHYQLSNFIQIHLNSFESI